MKQITSRLERIEEKVDRESELAEASKKNRETKGMYLMF